MDDRLRHAGQLGTVLIVDAEDAVRLILARLLGHLGYGSHAAVDAASALELVARCPFDCVLLNVELPDTFDADTARQLLAVAPDLRLVLMSSSAAARVVAQVIDVPAVGYLQKPFSYEELRRTLSLATARTV